MDLLLDIRQADNIDTALAGYFRRESLGQGENMYRCEKCKQKVPATKQYKIERPPMVLCIQLKRFNLMGGKNGRPVTLARKLNISNHVRWARQHNIPVEYRLVSMINHVGPSPNCGHYTSIGEAANGTFYRFDDASVHPTSLQNALNTSAYVVFYEILKTSKNLILKPKPEQEKSKLDVSPKVATKSNQNGQEKKIIGPQLPPQMKTSCSPKPSTSGPKPKLIQDSPTIKPKPASVLQIKPKLISEPQSKPLIKPAVAPTVKSVESKPLQGLVPYDDGSSSEEEAPKPASTLKPTPQGLKSMPAASSSPSPFLPRSVAVNFKKIKETQKDSSPPKSVNMSFKSVQKTENDKITSILGPSSSKSEILSSKPASDQPNRDPSSEALYSKPPASEESPKALASKTPNSKNEFVVTDLDSHNPSVHSDNSTGSTTSFCVSDIGPSKNALGSSDVSVTSRHKWSVTSYNKESSNGKDSDPKSKSLQPNRSAGSSSKRDRSVPPKLSTSEKVLHNNVTSDTELMGSPMKRKKTVIFDGGNLLEKAAEIAKEDSDI